MMMRSRKKYSLNGAVAVVCEERRAELSDYGGDWMSQTFCVCGRSSWA